MRLVVATSTFLLLAVWMIAPTAAQQAAQERSSNAAQQGQRDKDPDAKSEAKESSHKGEFVKMTKDKLTMTINGKNEHTHNITQSTKVMLNGREADFEDLKEGDKITVTIAEGNVATKIEARSNDRSEDREGQDAQRDDRRTERDGQRTEREGQSSRRQGDVAREDQRSRRDDQQSERVDQARGSRQPSAQAQRAESEGRDQVSDEERAVLGISIAASPTHGVFVNSVNPFGPAAKAGLRNRDYITQVNGEQIKSPRQFSEMIEEMQPGDEVEMTIFRNGSERQLVAKLQAGRSFAFRPPPGAEEQFAEGDRQFQQGQHGQHGAGQRQPSRAWLGVTLESMQQQQQRQQQPAQPGAQPAIQQGVRISGVFPNGPAAKAGLRQGDILLTINGQQADRVETVINAVSQAQPETPVEIDFMRGNQRQSVSVKLADRSQMEGEQFSHYGEPDHREMFWQDFDDFEDEGQGFQYEQFRRLAEQNQRLERVMHSLQNEIRQLRSEMRGGPGAVTPQPGGAQRLPQEAAPGTARPAPPVNRPQNQNQRNQGGTQAPPP